MAEIEILHRVPLVRTPPRLQRPRLVSVPVRTPVSVREADPGFLRPIGDAMAAVAADADHPEFEPRRLLRSSGDGLWAVLMVYETSRERQVRPAWPARPARPPAADEPDHDLFGLFEAIGDGDADAPDPGIGNADGGLPRPVPAADDEGDMLGFLEAMGLGPEDDDLVEGERNIEARREWREATIEEAFALLSGSATLYGREETLLRHTPLLPVGVPEGEGPQAEPTADEVDAVRARIRRWVDACLRIEGGALWIRIGVPGIRIGGNGVICQADALRLSRLWHRSMVAFSAPSGLCPLAQVDAYIAVMGRLGLRFTREEEESARRLGGLLLAEAPGFAGARDLAESFVGRACAYALATAAKAPSRYASGDAPALREDLRAGLSDLAPWAALGVLGLVEVEEIAEAAASLDRVLRLLARSYPLWPRTEEFGEIRAYLDAVVAPSLGHAEVDEGALAGLIRDGGAGATASAPDEPFTFTCAGAYGSAVVDERGRPLAKVVALLLGLDGKVVRIQVRVGRRQFQIPFDEVRLERADPGTGDLSVVVDRGVFEDRLLAGA